VECVVRNNCPPRGPKKGYLKTLQKKVGKYESYASCMLPLAKFNVGRGSPKTAGKPASERRFPSGDADQ
jgi:hypothetical protein